MSKNKVFALRDIPSVMQHKLVWPVAAKVMQRWFDGSAYQMPSSVKKNDFPASKLPPAVIDESLVTMKWAMSFKRVQTAVALLTKEWNSPNGLKRLQALVREQGKQHSNSCWLFGNFNQATKYLDEKCQVNFRIIGDGDKDPLDDFYGAMGLATLKVAVSGLVESDNRGNHVLDITELGFYLRDTYDFIDDGIISQPLGFWGYNGVQRNFQLAWDVEIEDKMVEEARADLEKKYYEVQNNDFAAYRTKFKKGGDFVIYSDLHRAALSKPLRITI